MNSGFIGYNRDLVANLISKVQENYDLLMTKLTDGVQSNYIESVKVAWVCPDAVNFFKNEFTNSMRELIDDINVSMISVSDAINSSCDAYARAGGDVWARRELTTRPFSGYTIDGVIVEFNESLGGQGGNLNAYKDAETKLAAIKADCASYTNAITAAAGNSGFVGAEQAQKLQAALQAIDNRITDAFTQISNATNNRINSSIEQFGMIGAGTSSAYTVS